MDDINYDSGIYLLEIKLNKLKEIKIGARGLHSFPDGYYYYCGSAQKNLKSRIERHLAAEKKFHWHIDYLLDNSEITDYKTWPFSADKECKLAVSLQEKEKAEIIVEGFGASDCNCVSHLIYFVDSLDVRDKEWF